MKKFSLLILLLVITSQGFCQQTKEELKKSYIMKSNTQKTVAWILLGGGAITTGVGYSTMVKNAVFIFVTKGVGTFLVGIAMMASSIPFFISAHKFSKKASLALTKERIPVMGNGCMVMHYIPAIKLRLQL